ncbi:SusC/RagA family TonB-linked outer membrane protein [Membranihabitans maritimus]|uniref:SusC/RagA family TonB-linked outer membrane protein n=1 Tax=Membranihabitans maritimus TaxID=2904244 RepID=UPI001F26C397|nr:TonB-dependent receptor [Membranihabitans maritimus]
MEKKVYKLKSLILLLLLYAVNLEGQSLVSNFSDYTHLNDQFQGSTLDNSETSTVKIEKALEYLQKKFQVNFSYLPDLKSMEEIPFHLLNLKDIEYILEKIFKGSQFNYNKVGDGFYVIFSRIESPEEVKELNSVNPYNKNQYKPYRPAEKIIEILPSKTKIYNFLQDDVLNIEGQIVDVDGNPLIGVNVLVKGSDLGTATDFDGFFSLENIDEDAVLLISYIGYKSQEVAVDGRTDIQIILEEDSQTLDEVVVVGYGAKKRKDIISGISSLSTEQMGLIDQPTPTAGDLLKGRVSGVSIREGTGAAGSTPSIRVRGISSINAGLEPLVVIDGFPVGNGFPQTLNSDDIASISVLKDAEATAIYGARGSNGVVLIETTSARIGVSEFNYNTYVGVNQVPQNWRPQMMNALEYANYNIERIEELDEFSGATSPTPIPEIFLDVVNNPDQWRNGGTDWFDEYIREGTESLTQNHNLTYKSGNEKLRTVISGGYLGQNGLLPGDDFNRLSLRGKFDANLSKRIKLGVNLSGARTVNNRIPTDGLRSTLWAAIASSPLKSPYDENGRLTKFIAADAPGYFSKPNPIFESLERTNEQIQRDLQVNIDLDITILDNLHYRPRVYGRQFTRETDIFKPTTIGLISLSGVGDLSRGAPPQINNGSYSSYSLENWGVDNLLTYNFSLRENHNIDFTLGHTIQYEEAFLRQINGNVFPSDDIINYNEAGEVTGSNDFQQWALLAGFGRLSYNFRGKYLAEVNFRREGSSRLGKNNRFDNFPSGAVGWRISEESFFPKENTISELMLRGSFGKTGNNAIGNFESLGRLGSVRTVIGDAVMESKFLTTLSNEGLQWETSLQYQVGLNLGLYNDFITLKVDYYKKTTENMLFNVNLPSASGFSSSRVNIGEMVNDGIDFEISSFAEFNKVRWNSSLNISFMRNEVTKMPDQIDKILVGGRGGTNITMVGEEVGALHGLVRLGFFDENTINDPNLHGFMGADKILGTNIFKDLNGDGVVDRNNDMTVIGSPHPDFIFGFNNQVSWKNLSFTCLLTGMLGYDIMPTVRDVDFNQVARYNVNKLVLNRWKSPEDPGDGIVPRSEVNPGSREWMDAWLEPGDHLWIKNVKLSYSLPSYIVEKIGSKQLRFYFSINNLARFDNYSGFNPEVGSGGNSLAPGLDDYVYPLSRFYTLGANLTF